VKLLAPAPAARVPLPATAPRPGANQLRLRHHQARIWRHLDRAQLEQALAAVRGPPIDSLSMQISAMRVFP